MSKKDKEEFKPYRKYGGLVTKFYPKGDKIVTGTEIVDGKKKDILWPNDSGKHLVRMPGKGLVYVNRENSRRKLKDREYNKKGFSGHVVNPSGEGKQAKKHPIIKFPAYMTNHLRHRERQIERELKSSKKKEKENV